MKNLWLFCMLFFLAGCQTPLQKQLNTADAITVHFYNNARADSVVKIVRTTSKDAVQHLSAFIENRQANIAPSCGHDGDIIFYKGERVVQVLDFNLLQLNCRHFAFENGGKHYVLQMNNEAADFLLALWAGKRNF
jgi:hypothetical protein